MSIFGEDMDYTPYRWMGEPKVEPAKRAPGTPVLDIQHLRAALELHQSRAERLEDEMRRAHEEMVRQWKRPGTDPRAALFRAFHVAWIVMIVITLGRVLPEIVG